MYTFPDARPPGNETVFNSLPEIIFYPLALLWSALYGAPAGAFFRLVAVYENWAAINRLQLQLWKRYPQRSYKKYINEIWASQVAGKPVELAEYTRSRIEKAYPAEPFPIFRLFTNTVFMLLIAPFMALRGLYDGPVYVFRRLVSARRNRQVISRQY